MQITYYRHKKGVLRMHSRDMEYIVGLLKNGKDAEAILSVRRKLNMAFLARTTDSVSYTHLTLPTILLV